MEAPSFDLGIEGSMLSKAAASTMNVNERSVVTGNPAPIVAVPPIVHSAAHVTVAAPVNAAVPVSIAAPVTVTVTFAAPILSSIAAPVASSIAAPVHSSIAAPVVSSIAAPIVSSVAVPVVGSVDLDGCLAAPTATTAAPADGSAAPVNVAFEQPVTVKEETTAKIVAPDLVDLVSAAASSVVIDPPVAEPLSFDLDDMMLKDLDVRKLYDELDVAFEPILKPASKARSPVKGGKKRKKGKSPIKKPPASGSAEFLAPSDEFKQKLKQGGNNPSIDQDQWALNRLKKFQEHIGQNPSVDFADMPANEAAKLLCRFFEQITKKDGTLYPFGSLMNLLSAFNRVLVKKQEARIIESGIDEPPFRIKSSPIFHRACVALVLAMQRSIDAGANQPRKKAPVVAITDEKTVLASEAMGKFYARGLQRRVGFYCGFRFSIRAAKELHDLCQRQFTFGEDIYGQYIEYNEHGSKAKKASMTKFQQEHMRAPLRYYEDDVIDTFRRYFKRLPEGMEELFLTPIDNPANVTWYYKTPVGVKPLTSLVKYLQRECGLDVGGGTEQASNKCGRTTMISRMSAAGHKNENSYSRYDRSTEAKIRAAQLCIADPTLSYEAAYEVEKGRTIKAMVGVDMNKEESHVASKKARVEEITGNDAAVFLEPEAPVLHREPRVPVVSIAIADKGKSIVVEKDIGKSMIISRDRGKGSSVPRVVVDNEGESSGTTENAMAKKLIKLQQELQFAQSVDWNADMEGYERAKAVVLNPINALFGKLKHCTINITYSSGSL